jgi:type II secretory pathway pseudopilin PulG
MRQKQKMVVTWGMTYRELLLIVIVLGLGFGLILPRVLASKHDAVVSRAVTDMDHFRAALEHYEKDYGSFPDREHSGTKGICIDLKDPDGDPYIVLPDDGAFSEFFYEPEESGRSYSIRAAALDSDRTPIFAGPNGVIVG